ncbi:Lrp/AsnC ligand binding domain-containing protein [Aestuariispira insulae]|uniref:AsnC family transcriptional regulator n=1 Tax=Aestuariispira insulae TaxID=1461337 RepID=A0A3D9H6V1_9PROT|nr:Lrp/AsnC ligand binding domain-containing protein [Aestuariispira insulae]RED44676.1 AsnC family transcriptional regulator [Aestuariispira insulae]
MASEVRELDRIDRKILRTLQDFGRLSNVDLAKMVNLSPTPCLERVRRLERDGFIKGYKAILEPAKLGQALTVFVQMTLDRTTPDVFDLFRDKVRELPEVVECHMVAGGFDYLLKIRVRDMTAFRHFLGEQLTSLTGVLTTHSYVVMEGVKEGDSVTILES